MSDLSDLSVSSDTDYWQEVWNSEIQFGRTWWTEFYRELWTEDYRRFRREEEDYYAELNGKDELIFDSWQPAKTDVSIKRIQSCLKKRKAKKHAQYRKKRTCRDNRINVRIHKRKRLLE